MRDDPRRNLKWLEQELLAEDRIHRDFSKLPDQQYHSDDELLELVDMLISEDAPEGSPVRNPASNYTRATRGEKAARAHAVRPPEESAYVPVKTKKQLRQEAKQAKTAEKKAGVNRDLKGLTFLAILEILGILAILGWWLQ